MLVVVILSGVLTMVVGVILLGMLAMSDSVILSRVFATFMVNPVSIVNRIKTPYAKCC